MTIYDKLKDAFVSSLREIAGISENEAKKELSALEFELRKLAEKVERGEQSLEDAVRTVTKKVEIYSPPAFRQEVQDRVRESCNSLSLKKPKQKSSKFVKGRSSKKIIPFSELVPIPETIKYLIQKKGFMDHFNQWYRYRSCLAASVYYQFKPVKHIEPIKVVRKKIAGAKKPIPVHVEFDGFEISYDEITSHFHYIITGDVSKYGKDFIPDGLMVIFSAGTVRASSESSYCFMLSTNIVKRLEDGYIDLSDEGLGVLFAIASLIIESCRAITGDNFYHNALSNEQDDRCKDYIRLAILKQLIVTEDEFHKIVETCQPPEGYMWARTVFGRWYPGKFRVMLKKSTPPKYHDTDLERKFEEILNELGFKEGPDYQKQYQVFGYWIDFAFPHIKIAFEPGATYFHTLEWVEGEALEPFGFSPEEVYYPAKKSDIRKDRVLKSNGWLVGWLNENFIKNIPEVKRCVRAIINGRERSRDWCLGSQ